jgi:cystathionine beta-lyase
LFDIAVSFGSVASTISLPAKMSHASIPQSLKERIAPPSDLVRLSIGIEDVDDLIDDLAQAFDVAADGGLRRRPKSHEPNVSSSPNELKATRS